MSGAPRRSRLLLLGVIAAALIAASIVGAIHVMTPTTAGASLTDLRGRAVAPDAGSGLSPALVTDMHAQADTGTRFEVPSVGLDVPLGALDMARNTITPPGFSSAYLVRNLGVAPSASAQGTVFVAMHSLRGGGVGPGNYLIDVAKQKAKVAVGAKIDVAGVEYTITSSRAIGKGDISRDRSVWADVPGRLVVITCLQRRQGGPSLDNLVIVATRDA
ncbi:MAG TPA: class F sortase [Gryllotalpicola sp.]